MNELEQRWRDLGEFIREQRRIDRLSLRKLSEMAGVSNPYLSQIERGLRKPSAEILQQIARALEISAESLYVRAGILDEADLEHDLVAAIRRDTSIDEDQKKTLIHIYESFVAERQARSSVGLPNAVAAGSAAEPAPALGAAVEAAADDTGDVLDGHGPVTPTGSTPPETAGDVETDVEANVETDVESLADVQR